MATRVQYCLDYFTEHSRQKYIPDRWRLWNKNTDWQIWVRNARLGLNHIIFTEVILFHSRFSENFWGKWKSNFRKTKMEENTILEVVESNRQKVELEAC